MRLVGLALALNLASLAAAQDLDGFWKDETEPGTVYRFTVNASGEATGVLTEKAGVDAASVYQTRNQDFQGRPLLGHPWIWGLKLVSPRFWAGGLAVDTRDPQGAVYYCRVFLSPDGQTLTLENVPGLSPDHRPLVLKRWNRPSEDPPPKAPLGNLLPDLWAENPEDTAKKQPPKPILGKEADKIVFGTAYYGLIIVIVLLTAATLALTYLH